MTDYSTHGTFKELLDSIDPALRTICRALREAISALHRDHVEIVWQRQRIASYGLGPRKMTEHYAYIGAHKTHLNLGFYHGTALDDPSGLLEGTGKHLRHVKIRSVAEARSVPVRELLAEAIAERERALS